MNTLQDENAAACRAMALEHVRRQELDSAEQCFARLQLGIALEQSGQAHDALMAYFTAVRSAQLRGRWLSDETTAPALRDMVKYAMRYANEGRHCHGAG